MQYVKRCGVLAYFTVRDIPVVCFTWGEHYLAVSEVGVVFSSLRKGRLYSNHVRTHGGYSNMQYVKRCGVLAYFTVRDICVVWHT